LAWAATQNNFGTALTKLAEREGGTIRLVEAIAAFRGALDEYTCDQTPLEWAYTQGNLAAALWRLGQREGQAGRFKEAFARCQEALGVWEGSLAVIDNTQLRSWVEHARSWLEQARAGQAESAPN
jgi:hypothetical protein